MAEEVGYNELVLTKRNGGSIEDIRKANQIYIAARGNRQRAEGDHREWQRAERVTLFYDEARDLASRPHEAARNMLSIGAKELAVRCHGQSQKAIETTINQWLDRLAATIHSAI